MPDPIIPTTTPETVPQGSTTPAEAAPTAPITQETTEAAPKQTFKDRFDAVKAELAGETPADETTEPTKPEDPAKPEETPVTAKAILKYRQMEKAIREEKKKFESERAQFQSERAKAQNDIQKIAAYAKQNPVEFLERLGVTPEAWLQSFNKKQEVEQMPLHPKVTELEAKVKAFEQEKAEARHQQELQSKQAQINEAKTHWSGNVQSMLSAAPQDYQALALYAESQGTTPEEITWRELGNFYSQTKKALTEQEVMVQCEQNLRTLPWIQRLLAGTGAQTSETSESPKVPQSKTLGNKSPLAQSSKKKMTQAERIALMKKELETGKL